MRLHRDRLALVAALLCGAGPLRAEASAATPPPTAESGKPSGQGAKPSPAQDASKKPAPPPSGTAPDATSPPAPGHLWLLSDPDGKPADIQAGIMKPFDLYLVAEREGAKKQISAVAYKLQLSEGLVVVGEELLVESLVALGSSREGMNLVFRCVETPRVRVLHWRIVATRVLSDAKIELLPDTRTNWIGVVFCRDEMYDKVPSDPQSVRVNVHS